MVPRQKHPAEEDVSEVSSSASSRKKIKSKSVVETEDEEMDEIEDSPPSPPKMDKGKGKEGKEKATVGVFVDLVQMPYNPLPLYSKTVQSVPPPKVLLPSVQSTSPPKVLVPSTPSNHSSPHPSQTQSSPLISPIPFISFQSASSKTGPTSRAQSQTPGPSSGPQVRPTDPGNVDWMAYLTDYPDVIEDKNLADPDSWMDTL